MYLQERVKNCTCIQIFMTITERNRVECDNMKQQLKELKLVNASLSLVNKRTLFGKVANYLG